ncbi:MAG: WcaF family extracellular polysaccharide biosynthesis acetyltransferase [Lacibacter sp.]
MEKTRLDTFRNPEFDPGRNSLIRGLWYVVNFLFFKTDLLPISLVKKWILLAFGAKVGHGVVLKPGINIKYPWKLTIGHYCWLGEGVWIDNLDVVTIGNHVCISQGAFLLTGNHNYKKSSFDLVTRPIELEDGVWIGAKSIVCPGVTCCSHSVLSVGSVATKNLEPYFVYSGNPAVALRKRSLNQL